MKKVIIPAFSFVLFWFMQAVAQLNTMADHYPLIDSQRWDNILNKFVNDTVYKDNYRIGDIKLQNTNLTIQPHGSYLDVTESAFISIIPEKDNLDYYISGRLSVPAKSVIASVYVSKDDTSGYSARILPSYRLDFPIDSTLGDALVLIKKSNVYNATDKADFDYYDFRLNSTIPGKDYHVVIRYLVPNRGNPNTQYNLNLLLANSSYNNSPSEMALNFTKGIKEKTYTLSIGNLNYQLSDEESLRVVPFKKNFFITLIDRIPSMAHMTDFTDGTWKGKYLLLNTSIPDSVMINLSKKLETVVLWRWNKPSSFVKKFSNDSKSITSYGDQAISQAQAIRTLDSVLVNTGNQVALVHSIEYQSSPQKFGMGGKGSNNYAKLDGYLKQIDNDYLLNSGYFETDVAPEHPDDTLLDSSFYEFRKSMQIVNGLYSNGKGILKHLIIVSAGPIPVLQNINNELDSLFKDTISIDCDHAVWRHVSFPIVKNISLLKTQRPLIPFADSSFKLPEFRPSSIILKVSNASRNYSFPLSPDQASFSIIAKSDSSWNKELIWNGFDRNGLPFSTAKSIMESYVSDKDTGLVKLWAGNSDRLPTSESGLELKYGVVSEDYCLKIYPSFKGYDSTATAYATAEKYYAPDTSDKPVTSVRLIAGADKLICSITVGKLLIKLPENGFVKRIRIYSLNGKLLVDFDPAQFRTPAGYVISLSSLHMSETFRGVVLIRIDSSGGTFKRKMIMR
jgi:hypothetical protein